MTALQLKQLASDHRDALIPLFAYAFFLIGILALAR